MLIAKYNTVGHNHLKHHIAHLLHQELQDLHNQVILHSIVIVVVVRFIWPKNPYTKNKQACK